jgi:hypothetical protein
LLSHYIDQQNVLRLQQITGSAEDKGYVLTRIIDRNSKQAFLLIHDAAGVPFALANLAARTQDTRYIDNNSPLSGQVTEYINQRKAWLIRQAD